MVWHGARRLIIGVVGTSVLLVGIALIVLPGPAFVVIPAGLAILASEFVWARRLLRKFKQSARSLLPGSWGRSKAMQSIGLSDSPRPAASTSSRSG